MVLERLRMGVGVVSPNVGWLGHCYLLLWRGILGETTMGTGTMRRIPGNEKLRSGPEVYTKGQVPQAFDPNAGPCVNSSYCGLRVGKSATTSVSIKAHST